MNIFSSHTIDFGELRSNSLLTKYILIQKINYNHVLRDIIKANDIPALKELLETNKSAINLNHENEYEHTPLTVAARIGNIQVVDLLIKSGALIDFKNCDGQTALLLACENGYTEVVALLLKYGANKNIKYYRDTETVFSIASRYGYTEIVEMLSK